MYVTCNIFAKGFHVTFYLTEMNQAMQLHMETQGIFPYTSLQLNRTDILSDVPSMLLSSRGPLALKWNYLPKMIPWFTKFVLNSQKQK